MIEGIICVGGVYLVYTTLKNIDKMTSSDDDYSFSRILFNAFGLVAGILGALIGGFVLVQDITNLFQNRLRYPASEYRIETEITTRGSTSDTTYIITRR